MRPGLDLRQRVALHPAIVAVFHLLGHDLAASGIDTLADDYERAIEADN
jgi:hypothetical protein